MAKELHSRGRNLIPALVALVLLVLTARSALCQDPGSPESSATSQSVDKEGLPVPGLSDPAKGLENEELDPDGGESGLSGFLQTLAALAVVIALIFAVGFLLKRYGPTSPSNRGGAIELLVSKSVAPKNRLLLVRFGKRLLLLGSGPGGLSTLCETSDPQEAAAMMEGGEGKLQ